MAEWLKTHDHSHLGFVAIRDDVTIGEGWLALVERIPGPGQFLRRSAYLQAIYMEPSQRNIGIGALLIDEMIKTARELNPVSYTHLDPRYWSFEQRPPTFEQRRRRSSKCARHQDLPELANSCPS